MDIQVYYSDAKIHPDPQRSSSSSSKSWIPQKPESSDEVYGYSN